MLARSARTNVGLASPSVHPLYLFVLLGFAAHLRRIHPRTVPSTSPRKLSKTRSINESSLRAACTSAISPSMLVGGLLTGVASTACLTDARGLTTAVPFMPLFESLRVLRADPSRRTRPMLIAVRVRETFQWVCLCDSTGRQQPDTIRSTSTCCPLRVRDAPPPSLPLPRAPGRCREVPTPLPCLTSRPTAVSWHGWREPAPSPTPGPTPGYHHASSPNC